MEKETVMEAKKHKLPDILWAGTDETLLQAQLAYEAMVAGMFDRQQTEPEKKQVPFSFSQQGDIGIITIRGALVNFELGYRSSSYTSYSDIQRAAVHAATEAGVKAVLLHIDSGGGAVNGVADTGNLIMQLGKVKPVYTYAAGTMASAAIWLGAAATKGKMYISPTSVVGSVGVITTHMEISKMLKEMGVGVKVLRAGEYKALASMYEPLSEKAEKQIQDQLNGAYGIFAGHMAERRGVTLDKFEATMGQGREFFGADAVKAGLVDGVKSFDSVMSMIQGDIDRKGKKEDTAFNNFQGSPMNRQALTEQQIAALQAAGVPLEAASTPDPEAEAKAKAEAEAKAKADAEAKAKADAEAALAAATPGADKVLAVLTNQLAEANTALTKANVDLALEKAKVTAFEAVVPGLTKIVAQSISTMRVALGGSAVDLSAMKPEALLAEHATTLSTFQQTFKGGRSSAAPTAEADKGKVTSADDPMRQARLKATSYVAKKA